MFNRLIKTAANVLVCVISSKTLLLIYSVITLILVLPAATQITQSVLPFTHLSHLRSCWCIAFSRNDVVVIW